MKVKVGIMTTTNETHPGSLKIRQKDHAKYRFHQRDVIKQNHLAVKLSFKHNFTFKIIFKWIDLRSYEELFISSGLYCTIFKFVSFIRRFLNNMKRKLKKSNSLELNQY